MAKKPVKKPTKKKPLPKKKAVKPAPKKVAKKVAKPAKKAAPVKKAIAKPLKKPLKAKPIPPKVVEKAAKKEKISTKAAKAGKAPVEEVAPVEAEEVEPVEELVLTDAEGRRFCRVRDCDQLASVDSYCRYHYLLFWKKIQVRKKILTEGKLERYIEELTARYPDKFLDMLRKDLRSEKEFLVAIQELEIDESAIEGDLEEEAQTYIDEVRGMEPTTRETDEDF
jgi:hypothetical protein